MLFDPEISVNDPSMAETLSLQRSNGSVRVGFARNGKGQTVLESLHQSGAAKVRFPKVHDDEGAQAVLINTAGGMTGGDRFDYVLSTDPGAVATVTTQACEKIYRAANGGPAEITTTVRVHAGSRISWLPQETIVYDGGRLSRTLDVDLAGGATFLGVESFLLGRRAMGEKMNSGSIRDRWLVRREGKLVFADAIRLSGDVAALTGRPAVLAGNTAFSTLVYCGGAPGRFLDRLRDVLGDFGAASAFDGKLLARIACPDGMSLRTVLIGAIGVMQDGRPLPRIWYV